MRKLLRARGEIVLYARRLMKRGRWMLAALGFVVGCGSASTPPAAPTASTTASSSTTTTAVVTTSTAHYVGTITPPAPLPPLPLDLSLFFTVKPGAILIGSRVLRPAATTYNVTGGYNTGPLGFSGTIQGSLDGTPENGTFTGVLTATLATGCIASRNYQGPITQAALNWTPGADVNNCAGASPLTFAVTPPAVATPPTTSIPTTTTVGSTTTTTVGPTTTTIPACTYTLSIGATIDGYPDGGSFPVTVTAPAGCAWTTTTNVSWIHVPAAGTASGTGTFTFTAEANPGIPRTGTLTIAGQTVTFNQASQCSYTVAPTSVTAPAGGGPVSLTVTTGTGCGWTAAPSAPYLHLTAGSTGSGTGTIAVTVDANTSTSARTGTITVTWPGGSATVAITQAGATPTTTTTTTTTTVGVSTQVLTLRLSTDFDNYTVTGPGGFSCSYAFPNPPPVCTMSYPTGTSVTLTPSEFSWNWTGCDSHVNGGTTQRNSCTVIMNSSRTVSLTECAATSCQ